MKDNLRSFPFERLFVMLMCIALILPLVPIEAQEGGDSWADLVDWSDTSDSKTTSETEASKPVPETAIETTTSKSASETSTPKTDGQTPSLKVPQIDGAKAVKAANTAFAKVIGAISQIGAMFGKTAGKRIGGTSVSAIAMLIIAKFLQDRGPSWLRWVLYLSGGTMVAGSGANITQLIMGFLS
jgi:hypothetical protein